jgi:hypothetical protein
MFAVLLLNLSLAASFAPPCLEALGLIGPRKKEKKTGFDDVSYSIAVSIAASPLPLHQGFQFLFFIYVACDT